MGKAIYNGYLGDLSFKVYKFFKIKDCETYRTNIVGGYFTFPSAQVRDNFITNINNFSVPYIVIDTEKLFIERSIDKKVPAYKIITSPTPNRETGDGYHAIMYVNTSKYILYQEKENEDKKQQIFDKIKELSFVGILPEWSDYIVENLESDNIISFSTSVLPMKHTDNLVLNHFIDNLPEIKAMNVDIKKISGAVQIIKEKGLASGDLIIPVKNYIKLDDSLGYIDIMTKHIIPYIKKKQVHYNEGDYIHPAFKTGIILENKSIGTLFPKQQEIAQSIFNAMSNDVKSIFLNGGTGIGKTYLSIKLAYLVSILLSKKNYDISNPKFRVLIMTESHIADKWKGYVYGAIKPFGITPIIKDLNKKNDVDSLSADPKGPEFLIARKDLSKKSWKKKYVDYNKTFITEQKILSLLEDDCFDEITNDNKNLPFSVFDISNVSLLQMKYVAKKLEKQKNKKIIAFKNIYNSCGDVKGIYVVTTSNALKQRIKALKKDSLAYTINKSYHLRVKSLDIVYKVANDVLDKIKEEPVYNTSKRKTVSFRCDKCGTPIYKSLNLFLKKETILKSSSFKVYKSSDDSLSYSNTLPCHYIKSDGTPLSSQEIKAFAFGFLSFVDVSNHPEVSIEDYKYPYRSSRLLSKLTPSEIIKVKSLKVSDLINCGVHDLRILVKQCTCLQRTAVNKKPRQKGEPIKKRGDYEDIATGSYYRKIHGDTIDFFICDESHNYNSITSNQTKNYLEFIRASKYFLAMSGTMTDGKSSELYHTLFEIDSENMRKHFYEFNSTSKFINDYGRYKEVRIKRETKGTKQGAAEKDSSSISEIPGMSPKLYTNFMLDKMVSRNIYDMDVPLPSRKVFKHAIDTPKEILEAMSMVCNQIDASVSNVETLYGIKINAINSKLHFLLSYPNNPDSIPINYKPSTDNFLLAVPPRLIPKEDDYLPKEKKLLETLKKEIDQEGRCVLIYVQYTNAKGVSSRVYDVVSERYKTAIMDGVMDAQKKSEWIKKQYNSGVKVIILNPKRVSTGIDIIEYPTIYYYELGYSSKELRQAEARPFRPTQKKEVRIYYSYYKNTLQEEAIKLIANKKNAAQSFEGIIDDDILSSMGGAESTEGLKALAKVISTGDKIDEKSLKSFDFANEDDVIKYKELKRVSINTPIDVDEFTEILD